MDVEDNKFPLLPAITAIFVTILVLTPSASSKFISIGPLTIVGSTLFFPISYFFNDILTEVYGYERSRKIIWLGFGCQIFSAIMYALIDVWPYPSFWKNQDAYHTILGQTPRIVLASLSAYFVGEFMNSFVLSKLKYFQNGKAGGALAVRFVLSTFVGELFDSSVFMAVAFYGIMNDNDLLRTIVTIWLLKSVYEVLALPLSLPLTAYVKRSEGVDRIDSPESTNYSPFHF